MAASQAGACLHTMVILHTRLTCLGHEGEGVKELHWATDLFLQANKEMARAIDISSYDSYSGNEETFVVVWNIDKDPSCWMPRFSFLASSTTQ